MRIILDDTAGWDDEQVDYYQDKLSWMGMPGGDWATVMVRYGDLRRLMDVERVAEQTDPELNSSIIRLRQAIDMANV